MFFFPIRMPLFDFLGTLTRTFRTMLNRSGKSGPSCLVSDLKECVFNVLPVSIMSSMGFSYTVILQLRFIPSIFTLVEFFSRKNVEFCQMISLHLWLLTYDVYL